jgi:hypothetical protein
VDFLDEFMTKYGKNEGTHSDNYSETNHSTSTYTSEQFEDVDDFKVNTDPTKTVHLDSKHVIENLTACNLARGQGVKINEVPRFSTPSIFQTVNHNLFAMNNSMFDPNTGAGFNFIIPVKNDNSYESDIANRFYRPSDPIQVFEHSFLNILKILKNLELH